MQRLERERRVADPGVAVVPVALAARRLRERRRERRDGRAGRHVGEALDRRAPSAASGRASGDRGSRAAQPRAPEARRGAIRASASSASAGARAPRPRRGRSTPCRPAASAWRARTRVPSISSARSDVEPECLRRRRWRQRHGRLALDQRPRRRRAPVVERGLADELDLDLASRHSTVRTSRWSASSSAGGRVCGVMVVLVIPGADRERVADDDPAVASSRSSEDVRPGLVDARRRVDDPERREAEEAGLPVEQAAEDARGVEGGMQSQSIAPSGATSAPVWQSERNA